MIKVYRQHHKDYPPWVATVRYENATKIYITNFEGQTEQEARNKAERYVRENPDPFNRPTHRLRRL